MTVDVYSCVFLIYLQSKHRIMYPVSPAFVACPCSNFRINVLISSREVGHGVERASHAERYWGWQCGMVKQLFILQYVRYRRSNNGL